MTGILLALVAPAFAHPDDIAIVGGTLIDVSAAGHAAHDVADATILIRDGRIRAIGPAKGLHVPAGSQVVDASGLFVVPGLIDGFGSLRTQRFADAYLYEGVTTVAITRAPAGADGEQEIFAAAAGPRVIVTDTVGGFDADGSIPRPYPWLSGQPALPDASLVREIMGFAAGGARALLIGLDVSPSQLTTIVRAAQLQKLGTSGEFALTSYRAAATAGVNVFIRNDHYLTALASPQALDAMRLDPVGKGAGPAYRAVCSISSGADAVKQYAQALVRSATALMPILSIEATADDVGAPNPWQSRSAAFVTAAELDDPVDPVTNGRPYLEQHPDRRQALQDCARHRQQADAQLHRLGVTYLAGSGTPAYGIMPGGGVHQELALLQMIGLTPREAVAAASANFSRVFGWRDVGLIERGRTADVLIVGSDPRRDVSSLSDIRVLIHDGRIVDRQALLSRWARHP